MPLTVPVPWPAVGGVCVSASGAMSLESVVEAKKPIPRVAKIDHRLACAAPPSKMVSAWRMALRMSRNEGSGGESSSARVMSRSARATPSVWRMSHIVSPQISPSAWTSGPE